ncbi:glycerol-3-phosphate 1-O-acyltransferase PlsY [Sphingomonas oryzagri]|uniref:Glycerol-3-phosphate acyltransferase n=1 Tax=Sphingomonas oryzagri TaxID=3042314 RepID=A0ABT6MX27_9SPHN|nr:glycerol-3-phosphate 1-O-acyltransferase PlsY [Sphingomonas oryzagri]MDH7637546.1 glycerol-3-phosphate 1-O-acyltransferase PlsY [Sphingomonas oryzagri]
MIATNWLVLGAAALIGYLLGSIPFGLLVTRAGGAEDPRTIGSGNIGATNVLRTGRKELAIITLLLDAAKGAVAVVLVGHVWPDPMPPSLPAIVAGAFAFLGHVYPVWLRFQGGKGVATFLGIALALSWPCGLAFALVWLAAFAITRHSSVGGMTAAIATPVAAAIINRSDLTLTFLLLALIVLWKHRANVERLLDGTEPRFGSKG